VILTEKSVKVSPVSRLLLIGGIIVSAAALALNAFGMGAAALGLIFAAGIAVVALDRLFDAGRGSENDPYVVLGLGPSMLFLLSVIALSVAPNAAAPGVFSILKYHGWIGILLGLSVLFMLGSDWKKALREYDWPSILFLIGIFVVIAAVDRVGLLKDFADWMISLGLKNPLVMFIIITWLSVLLSSFIDNVPYTVLMIPVCGYLAKTMGVNPFFFYYGMLVGTGIGGNITPVGATANVLACGMLEKRGYKIDLKKYMIISVPFSCAAVLATQLLLQLFWWK
jgi:Na+/H+ antiporter NhaD/arsenite permease-like protein